MIFTKETMENFYHPVPAADQTAIERTIVAFNQQLSGTKISSWINVKVDHSCLAYAARIDLVSKKSSATFSIVVSGDTRPTSSVRNLCQAQVDLLIHEATYEDTEYEMAKAKKHSTRSEAISMGRGLAKRILLTHFSQRYNGVRIETGRDDQTGTSWMTAVDGLKLPLNFE